MLMLGLGSGSGSALVSSYRCSFFINTIHIQVTYRITFTMYKSREVGYLAVVAYWVVCMLDCQYKGRVRAPEVFVGFFDLKRFFVQVLVNATFTLYL